MLFGVFPKSSISLHLFQTAMMPQATNSSSKRTKTQQRFCL